MEEGKEKQAKAERLMLKAEKTDRGEGQQGRKGRWMFGSSNMGRLPLKQKQTKRRDNRG